MFSCFSNRLAILASELKEVDDVDVSITVEIERRVQTLAKVGVSKSLDEQEVVTDRDASVAVSVAQQAKEIIGRIVAASSIAVAVK